MNLLILILIFVGVFALAVLMAWLTTPRGPSVALAPPKPWLIPSRQSLSCPVCRATLPDIARFCPRCGAGRGQDVTFSEARQRLIDAGLTGGPYIDPVAEASVTDYGCRDYYSHVKPPAPPPG